MASLIRPFAVLSGIRGSLLQLHPLCLVNECRFKRDEKSDQALNSYEKFDKNRVTLMHMFH